MSDNPSNNHNSNENDALLDQHIDALRNSSTEAGPSPQMVSATLKMLQTSRISAPQTQENRFAIGRRGFYQRLVAMTFAQRIAATVFITIGAAMLYFVFTLFNGFGTTVAFADVVQRIKSAHTLTCTATATFVDKPAVSIKILLADPDSLRAEVSGGIVSIVSHQNVMILNTTDHTATRLAAASNDSANASPAVQISIVDTIRNFVNAKGKFIGNKKINGIDASGFETQLYGRPVTIWAAKKDASPVRIELSTTDEGTHASMVFDHFEIDSPLDASLFSMDVPAGYTLITKKFDVPAMVNHSIFHSDTPLDQVPTRQSTTAPSIR